MEDADDADADALLDAALSLLRKYIETKNSCIMRDIDDYIRNYIWTRLCTRCDTWRAFRTRCTHVVEVHGLGGLPASCNLMNYDRLQQLYYTAKRKAKLPHASDNKWLHVCTHRGIFYFANARPLQCKVPFFAESEYRDMGIEPRKLWEIVIRVFKAPQTLDATVDNLLAECRLMPHLPHGYAWICLALRTAFLDSSVSEDFVVMNQTEPTGMCVAESVRRGLRYLEPPWYTAVLDQVWPGWCTARGVYLLSAVVVVTPIPHDTAEYVLK